MQKLIDIFTGFQQSVFCTEQYPDNVALKGSKIEVPIKSITEIGESTKIFKLELEQGQKLGIETGQHIVVHGYFNYFLPVRRAQTPISHPNQEGEFTLLIKIYRPNEKFPKGGKLSMYLDNLKPGDKMTISGPKRKYQYMGEGLFGFLKQKRQKQFDKFVMIAGGSGITPIYQIMQHCILYKEQIPITVISGNPNMKDILLYDELKKIDQEQKNIDIHFTVDRDGDSNKNIRTGLITEQLLKDTIPMGDGKTAVIYSGPKPMKKAVQKYLLNMGYTKEDFVSY